MKLLKLMKDGGPESRVWGYWLIEWKRFFSVVLLHFKDGSREAYHSHAFNAISWVLKGKLTEHPIEFDYNFEHLPYEQRGEQYRKLPINTYMPSLKPVFTPRNMKHKVESAGDTWALSFRGPWADTWLEYIPGEGWITLTHGREILEGGPGLP